jgi:eukaryotic-like serine/threonine-protein kinase
VTLSAGTRLGPYEILSPLGAGGMGEVYRARDSRLGREVAIKVLPESLASDQERLRRFEKEARSASALNHQNIVTIHDIGSESGVSYIAMELVDGATLRELLASGPLPIKKLLQIVPQIAEGLTRAHEVGIIHRDLKPENVMVKKDGLVKILDFGLAKLSSTGSGSDEASQLPTMTGTQPGVVVGTVSYLSPEQASGQTVDFRSDQFSLGSMLYEMATGRKAFQRKTGVDTLAAILNDEPEPIASIAPQTPVPLRWIVGRCHAKEPEGRYASTQDLGRDLANLRDHQSEVSGSIQTTPRLRFRRAILPVLAGTALALALALLIGRHSVRPPEQPVFHQLTFRNQPVTDARFTPDGHTVIYTALLDFLKPHLFSIRPESPAAAPLAIPEAQLASISPTGELAIVLPPSMLARAPITGGTPREIIDDVEQADWAPDGKAMAVVRAVGSRKRLEFPIGKVVYEAAGGISWPRVSPKGDRVAFLEQPTLGDDRNSVVTVDLSGKKTTLSEGWIEYGGLVWSLDGQEIWFAAGKSGADTQIHAVSLAGHERTVLALPMAIGLRDISRDGRVLFVRSIASWVVRGVLAGDSTERDLSWLDNTYPAELSIDGKALLLGDQGAASGYNFGVGLRKQAESATVRLGDGSALALSPDGKWALAYLPHPEPAQLALLPTGPGEQRVLTHDSINHMNWASWVPDGKAVVFVGSEPGHGSRIYVQAVDGGSPRAISPEGVSAMYLVSPDGKFVPARSTDGGWSLFSLDGGPPRRIVGISGDDIPIQWTADGGSLYIWVTGFPAKIYRLDLSNQRKELWKELTAPEPNVYVFNVRITRDGKSYAYNYVRLFNDLYLVDGLK